MDDVVVRGDLAYVTDRGAGLKIVDVSDPSAPVLLGSHDVTGSDKSYGVDVQGDVVYLANHLTGLQILDTSNPTKPRLLAAIDPAGFGSSVTVDGALAYLFAGSLCAIDVSDPSAPWLVASYDLGSTYDAAMRGSRAYVAYNALGVKVWDLAQPLAGITAENATTFRIDLPGPRGERGVPRLGGRRRDGPGRRAAGPGRRSRARRTRGRRLHVPVHRRRHGADGADEPSLHRRHRDHERPDHAGHVADVHVDCAGRRRRNRPLRVPLGRRRLDDDRGDKRGDRRRRGRAPLRGPRRRRPGPAGREPPNWRW